VPKALHLNRHANNCTRRFLRNESIRLPDYIAKLQQALPNLLATKGLHYTALKTELHNNFYRWNILTVSCTRKYTSWPRPENVFTWSIGFIMSRWWRKVWVTLLSSCYKARSLVPAGRDYIITSWKCRAFQSCHLLTWISAMWGHLRCETTKFVLELWHSFEYEQQKALEQVFHTCHHRTLHVTVNGDRWRKSSRYGVVSEVRGRFQNQIPIAWLKKYKTENKTLLHWTLTYITALLLDIDAIHIKTPVVPWH